MKRYKFCLYWATMLASAASAQELPTEPTLTEIARGSLPGYWRLDELEIVATTRTGDAAQPGALMRFEADATPTSELFVAAGEDGPFTLIVPTGTGDTARRLYGVFDLSYRAGGWNGTVQIENPVAGLGMPRDLFGAPTLIAGTEETTARLAALHDTEVAANAARMEQIRAGYERQTANMTAAHEKALGELHVAHAEKLADLQASNESEVSDLRSDGERRLTALRQEYDTRIAEVAGSKEPVVAEAAAERAKLLAEAEETSRQEIATLREGFETEFEKLRADHAARRGALIETQRQQLAELETKLATEKISLQRQLETAEDVIELQSALSEALSERSAGSERLLEAFNAARTARHDFFARLPKVWVGQVHCIAEGSDNIDFTRVFSIGLDSIVSGGATVSVDDDEDAGGVSGTLMHRGDGIAFPLEMRLQLIRGVDWDFPTSVTMMISQEGLMTGEAPMVWTIDQRRVGGRCSYRLTS